MIGDIKKRVERLELLRHGHALRVLVKLPSGIDAIMSVDEMIDQRGQLVRVVDGDSLSDLDKILTEAKKAAYNEIENMGV